MLNKKIETPINRTEAITLWNAMLRDEVELFRSPGIHHKALLSQAHVLHRAQVIDRDDLSDLLEQADGALAYAVEALLDYQRDE